MYGLNLNDNTVYKPNLVNNESQHADYEKKRELRHDTVSGTCDTQLILATHGDPSYKLNAVNRA